MLHNGMALLVDGKEEPEMVAAYHAQWSIKLSVIPHKVWILFEGAEKYRLFTSDASGNFPDLEVF